MSVETKDFAEVLGIDDPSKIENAEALKTELEKKWIPLDSAHTNKAVTDKVWGSVNRAGRKKLEDINSAFELGLEIDEKANLLDLLPKFSEALKPRFDSIKAMEEKLKTAAPADVVAKFEDEKKELSKKLKAFEGDATKWKSQYDELFTSVQTRDKTAKVEGEWSGALGAVVFSPQVDDLRKEGFVSKMKKEFQILLDEEGKPYAANAKGEPLMHPKKAAERWTLAEALKSKAEELKLIGTNPQGGRPANQPVGTPRQTQQQTPSQFAKRERKEAPRLM